MAACCCCMASSGDSIPGIPGIPCGTMCWGYIPEGTGPELASYAVPAGYPCAL